MKARYVTVRVDDEHRQTQQHARQLHTVLQQAKRDYPEALKIEVISGDDHEGSITWLRRDGRG